MLRQNKAKIQRNQMVLDSFIVITHVAQIQRFYSLYCMSIQYSQVAKTNKTHIFHFFGLFFVCLFVCLFFVHPATTEPITKQQNPLRGDSVVSPEMCRQHGGRWVLCCCSRVLNAPVTPVKLNQTVIAIFQSLKVWLTFSISKAFELSWMSPTNQFTCGKKPSCIRHDVKPH